LPSPLGGGAGVGGSSAAPASPAGLPPATGGSIESAVGSLDLGQLSSTRMSFGERTPDYRARCQDAQRASGSA
jgi:hypothetical protein